MKKKILLMAFLVAIASQIKFDIFVPGFIIALSVMVMVIFIYCYEDISPRKIIYACAIMSPLFRMLSLLYGGADLSQSVLYAIPDMAYFFVYGTIYTLIYKYIVKGKKTMRNFPFVVMACDFLSNIGEFTVRSIVMGEFYLTIQLVSYLILVAFVRTAMIQAIVVAFEAYSQLLLRNEHAEIYRKLISQVAIYESELGIMEKNISEIEDVMKMSFELYKELDVYDIPIELAEKALSVSKTAHEIKGDYKGIVRTLRDSYMHDFKGTSMSIRDIFVIEKANAMAYIRAEKLSVDISIKIEKDFVVEDFFQMLSIVRNLLMNGVEASTSSSRKIWINVWEDGNFHMMSFADEGKGIKEQNLENIFLPGFSTKFSRGTGDMQRGIGLSVVKDYTENTFNGEIWVESQPGKGTIFTIKIPKLEEKNEILHN